MYSSHSLHHYIGYHVCRSCIDHQVHIHYYRRVCLADMYNNICQLYIHCLHWLHYTLYHVRRSCPNHYVHSRYYIHENLDHMSNCTVYLHKILCHSLQQDTDCHAIRSCLNHRVHSRRYIYDIGFYS